jgi:hypothetical protein
VKNEAGAIPAAPNKVKKHASQPRKRKNLGLLSIKRGIIKPEDGKISLIFQTNLSQYTNNVLGGDVMLGMSADPYPQFV